LATPREKHKTEPGIRGFKDSIKSFKAPAEFFLQVRVVQGFGEGLVVLINQHHKLLSRLFGGPPDEPRKTGGRGVLIGVSAPPFFQGPQVAARNRIQGRGAVVFFSVQIDREHRAFRPFGFQVRYGKPRPRFGFLKKFPLPLKTSLGGGEEEAFAKTPPPFILYAM
jgi:hypothetical protein